MTDLIIGKSYTLSWHEGNFGAVTGPGYTGDNTVAVFLGGYFRAGFGSLLPLSPDWSKASFDFIANNTT